MGHLKHFAKAGDKIICDYALSFWRIVTTPLKPIDALEWLCTQAAKTFSPIVISIFGIFFIAAMPLACLTPEAWENFFVMFSVLPVMLSVVFTGIAVGESYHNHRKFFSCANPPHRR